MMNKRCSKKNSGIVLKLSVLILIMFSVMSCFRNTKVKDAFKHIERGLEISNQTMSFSNDSLRKELTKNGNYKLSVLEIEKLSKDFHNIIDSTINLLILQSGGWKTNSNKSELAFPRNMEVSTQILVKDGVGDKIENLILKTSSRYKEILANIDNDTIQIPLKLQLSHIKETGKSWSEYTFNQLPLFAVIPIFRKYKSDEYKSKNIIFTQLINKGIDYD